MTRQQAAPFFGSRAAEFRTVHLGRLQGGCGTMTK